MDKIIAKLTPTSQLNANLSNVLLVEGSGSNYEDLTNKPRINNVELVGNKTLEDLGIDIPSLEDYTTTNYVDDTLSNYATTNYVDNELENYASLQDVQEALNGYATESYVDNSLNDYTTKTYVDNNIDTLNNEIETTEGIAVWVNIIEEPTTTIESTKKSVEEIAAEVWEGNWGNGTDRKARLEAAGYDYAEV